MEHFIFTNARIVLPDTVLDNHYVSVKDGVIESIGKGTPDREQLNSCTMVDCGGQYLDGTTGKRYWEGDDVSARKAVQNRLEREK